MRIFVAVEITDKKRINSITRCQDEINIDAKSVELDNFHFTLQFLGEVSDEITDEIIEALNKIKFLSFDVHLKGVGTFPKNGFPRVIWIGTDENGGNMLIQLSKKVKKVKKYFT